MVEVRYKELDGFPWYRVGTDGSVWSRLRRGMGFSNLRKDWRKMKPTLTQNRDSPNCKKGGKDSITSRCYVTLFLPTGKRRVFVHTLVLETFVGQKPEGMTCCCHTNDIGTDNRLENLRWGTNHDNAADRVKNGNQHRGEKTPNSKLTEEQVLEIISLRASGESRAAIAAKFNITTSTMSKIDRGTLWKHLPRPNTTPHVRKGRASKYRGVSLIDSKKNPWMAKVYVNGVAIKLGIFPTEEAASAAYEAYLLANPRIKKD